MSSSDELRKKIERLQRGRREDAECDKEALRRRLRRSKSGPEPPAGVSPEPVVYRRDLPRTNGPAPRPGPRGEPVRLEDAVVGEPVRTAVGMAYQVVTPAEKVDGDWGSVCRRFDEALGRADSDLMATVAPLRGQATLRPRDVFFLDLETTGLGGSPVFLIGTMAWERGQLVVRQFLARDYAEERAILQLYDDHAAGRQLIVSFNGKSFDVPYLRVRCAATGMTFRTPPPHLDLLHVSRRVWGANLPNCKLQTLERHICGRRRYGDIPGSDIPDAYHDFVRTQDAREIVEILKHNLLDLLTLAELMVRLPRRANNEQTNTNR